MDTARAQHAELRSAALVGRVVVPANGKLGRVRIRIHASTPSANAWEFECEGGTWERFGLPPGTYRVELVADRIVLAKRVELAAGDEAIVEFEVR